MAMPTSGAHPRYRTRASTPIGGDSIVMDYFRPQPPRELEFDTDRRDSSFRILCVRALRPHRALQVGFPPSARDEYDLRRYREIRPPTYSGRPALRSASRWWARSV